MSNPISEKKSSDGLPDIPPEFWNGIHIRLVDGEEESFVDSITPEELQRMMECPPPMPEIEVIHVKLDDGEEESFVEGFCSPEKQG